MHLMPSRPFVPAVLLLSLFSLIGFSHTSATAGNNGGTPATDPELPVAVVLGTTYGGPLDSAKFANGLGALNESVSLSEYAVIGPGTFAITITDRFYFGDYYSLYEDTDPGFSSPAPALVGTTPQVHTGPQLTAPTHNPLWDGTGSAWSGSTLVVTLGAGTTYFVVVDGFFRALSVLDPACGTSTQLLLTSGCSVSGVAVSPGFDPAGYSITFKASSPLGAPEFDLGPLLAVAIAVPLVFLTRNRYSVPRKAKPRHYVRPHGRRA